MNPLLIKVIYYGVLTKKMLEDREIQIVYICSLLSNTLFIRKQNVSKLKVLSRIGQFNYWEESLKKSFFWGFHPLFQPDFTPALLLSWFFWKNWFLDQVSVFYLKNCRMPSFPGFKYFRMGIPFLFDIKITLILMIKKKSLTFSDIKQ